MSPWKSACWSVFRLSVELSLVGFGYGLHGTDSTAQREHSIGKTVCKLLYIRKQSRFQLFKRTGSVSLFNMPASMSSDFDHPHPSLALENTQCTPIVSASVNTTLLYFCLTLWGVSFLCIILKALTHHSDCESSPGNAVWSIWSWLIQHVQSPKKNTALTMAGHTAHAEQTQVTEVIVWRPIIWLVYEGL